MADISMCGGEGCPKRLQCYRHTAQPSPMQAWFSHAERLPDGSCDEFWPASSMSAKADAADPDSF